MQIDPSAVQIHPSWKNLLLPEFAKPYFTQIKTKLQQEQAAGYTIYPAGNQIFYAFDATPFEEVKVVILGQDPYHGAGEAHGLAFSVQEGIKIPPSLRNIYKELGADLGLPIPS